VAFSSFTDEGNNEIFEVDLDVGSRTRLTRGPEYDLEAAWSPAGRRIAFGRDGHLRHGRRRLECHRVDLRVCPDGAPSWSPDGRRIAFVRSDETGKTFAGPSRIIVMRSDGSRERHVPLDLQALSVTWVP
jgi:Tol biopolymer transport system component